nr:hypothetical protein [Pseudarthrobacter sp. NamE5]
MGTEVAPAKALEELNDPEQRQAQQQELDQHCDEAAVSNLGVVHCEAQLSEIRRPEDRSDELQQNVIGEAVHECSESRTDNEPQGESNMLPPMAKALNSLHILDMA